MLTHSDHILPQNWQQIYIIAGIALSSNHLDMIKKVIETYDHDDMAICDTLIHHTFAHIS